MVPFFLALNLVSSIGTLPTAKLNYIYKHLSSDEQTLISENNITTDDELESFIASKNAKQASDSKYDHSYSITNIRDFLSSNYSDYYLHKENGKTTKSISNGIPINVGGSSFPESEILEAIKNANVPSTYGGCGPIAIMGVMDYFSRYFGYDEYINNPTSSNCRITLAEDVLKKSKTFEMGFQDKSTLMSPGILKQLLIV